MKRRKASAPRKQISAQTAYTCLRGALPRPGIGKRQRLSVLRGNWLACAFRRFASPYSPRRIYFGVVVGKARARMASRERYVLFYADGQSIPRGIMIRALPAAVEMARVPDDSFERKCTS